MQFVEEPYAVQHKYVLQFGVDEEIFDFPLKFEQFDEWDPLLFKREVFGTLHGVFVEVEFLDLEAVVHSDYEQCVDVGRANVLDAGVVDVLDQVVHDFQGAFGVVVPQCDERVAWGVHVRTGARHEFDVWKHVVLNGVPVDHGLDAVHEFVFGDQFLGRSGVEFGILNVVQQVFNGLVLERKQLETSVVCGPDDHHGGVLTDRHLP